VLFLHNDPIAREALLGEVFTESGFDVDTFAVVPADRSADPLHPVDFPDPLRYDVIVPLGARWSAHDARLRDVWANDEMDMVRTAYAAGVGVLGVCFGGQLVAQALGGTVAKSPAPELGWARIDSDRPDFLPTGPWFQWHSDRWTLPPGATEIARTEAASQAFTAGSALALQFHPELDPELLEIWIESDAGEADDLTRYGVDPAELRARTAAEAAAAPDRLRTLVAAFLQHVRSAGAIR